MPVGEEGGASTGAGADAATVPEPHSPRSAGTGKVGAGEEKWEDGAGDESEPRRGRGGRTVRPDAEDKNITDIKIVSPLSQPLYDYVDELLAHLTSRMGWN